MSVNQPNFIEGLADWGIGNLVDSTLKGYVAKGQFSAQQVPVVRQAMIDVANLVAELALQKVTAGQPATDAPS